MDKMQKILLGIFVILLFFLVLMESAEKEPINWSPSYLETDKIALGSFVLFENLEKNGQIKIEKVGIPPYEKLNKDDFRGTYFFLNNHIGFDDAELEDMLSWVSNGNDLFISAKYLGEYLQDTLDLNVQKIFSTETIHSKPLFQLANPSLKAEKPFLFNHNTEISVFEAIDTAKTTVLGFAEVYNDTLAISEPEVNFIKTEFGKGEIYIHLAPEAFSNYFLLSEENYEYTEAALAYLDIEKILLWDNYYKAGKKFYTSPLYVLFSSKKLKWAYYTALLAAFLFIVFEGKRKQRSIPVIKPLENKTYNFTQTVAGLFYEKKQYKQIANKKIKLFLDYLRTDLRIHLKEINQQFLENVSEKSGNSFEKTKALFDLIGTIERKPEISKQDLLKLSQEIYDFKNR